jgi:hypothetical protein
MRFCILNMRLYEPWRASGAGCTTAGAGSCFLREDNRRFDCNAPTLHA